MNNARLVDPDKGIFEVVDTVFVRISSPYWARMEDIDEDKARGVVFRFYDDKATDATDIASISVFDASSNAREPDISLLRQEDVAELDKKMAAMFAEEMKKQGRTLIEWMSSQLNEIDQFRALVTAYIAKEAGKDRQFIAVRLSVRNKKIVAIGIFDVARAEELAAPIFGVLSNMKISHSSKRLLRWPGLEPAFEETRHAASGLHAPHQRLGDVMKKLGVICKNAVLTIGMIFLAAVFISSVINPDHDVNKRPHVNGQYVNGRRMFNVAPKRETPQIPAMAPVYDSSIYQQIEADSHHAEVMAELQRQELEIQQQNQEIQRQNQRLNCMAMDTGIIC